MAYFYIYLNMLTFFAMKVQFPLHKKQMYVCVCVCVCNDPSKKIIMYL